MEEKIILAVVGLPGAGKTEATNYLMQKTGWPKVYFGQGVIDEVVRRGQPVNEENERAVREDLRQLHGMAAMAIASLPKIREQFASSSVLLESLYSWEEYLKIKEEFQDLFKVAAIYSSPATRIARMKSRPVRPLTPEELVLRDYSQIDNLHQAGPIARADFTIVNEGTLEELYKNLDVILEKMYESTHQKA